MGAVVTTLNLGVVDDLRYSNKGTTKIADVAGYLERKYHIMEVFFELHIEQIEELLCDALQGQIETIAMGGSRANNPFGTAESKIEALFKLWLSGGGMDGLGVPGVPTQAALDGVNHRLKLKKGSPRPSFIDTGLYQASFKSWFD